MNLDFSSLRKIETVDGLRYVREAYPTSEFWAMWRWQKQLLLDQGINIIETPEGEWKVRQFFLHDEEKFKPVKMVPVQVKYAGKLLPYQVSPVSYLIASLLSHNIALDCSSTGIGKTYMTCAVAKNMNLQLCVICAKSGIPTWKQVCNYFNISPLFIVNWESVKSKNFLYGNFFRNEYTGEFYFRWTVPENFKGLFVFDEVHKANGRNTQNQAILLAAAPYKKILLSATLAERLANLKAIGLLLGLFKDGGFSDWMRAQGAYKNKYNRWQSLSDVEDMVKFNKIIFPQYGCRVRKEDIPGFPNIQNIARLYRVEKETIQIEAFNKLRQEIKKLLSKNLDDTKKQAIKLTLQLRYRQQAELYKIKLLTELAREYIELSHSVVIFVNFRETMDILKSNFNGCPCIYGNQPDIERIRGIKEFQEDKARIIICNIQAGGLSLSLHDLNGRYPRIALVCPTFRAIDLKQCLGRIHRAGAKSKAINMLVYALGTIEEKVYKNVSQKLAAINTLNDGDLAELEEFLYE